jgi:hypothetical protein
MLISFEQGCQVPVLHHIAMILNNRLVTCPTVKVSGAEMPTL